MRKLRFVSPPPCIFVIWHDLTVVFVEGPRKESPSISRQWTIQKAGETIGNLDVVVVVISSSSPWFLHGFSVISPWFLCDFSSFSWLPVLASKKGGGYLWMRHGQPAWGASQCHGTHDDPRNLEDWLSQIGWNDIFWVSTSSTPMIFGNKIHSFLWTFQCWEKQSWKLKQISRSR